MDDEVDRPIQRGGTPESAAWFRARLVELGETQGSLCRLLMRLGDDRKERTILRHLGRMANGEARVSGEMKALLGMIANGRAKAAKRRQRAEAAQKAAT